MQDTDLNAPVESLVSRVVKGQYGRSEIVTLTRRFNARCVDLANFIERTPNEISVESILRALPRIEQDCVVRIMQKRKYWRDKCS